MNKLYFSEISKEIYFEKFKKLLPSVSNVRQEQINRLHFDADKKLSLYSELLVRIEICKLLDIRNDEIVFGRNGYGKPYLKGEPNFYFNLSHTRNAIVVAISDKPIGIDIEKIRIGSLAIANRFFDKSEVAYITREASGKDKRFYEVWTKKEAYVKYIGMGLSVPLYSFNVFDNNILKQIQTTEKDGYIISVCSKCVNEKIVMIKLSEYDIEQQALEFLR